MTRLRRCIDWAVQPSVHFIMTRLLGCIDWALQNRVSISFMTRLRRVHWLSSTTECPFHYDSTTMCASIEQYNRVSIALWLDYNVCIDWAVQPSVHFILTRLRRVHRLSTLQTKCPFHYDWPDYAGVKHRLKHYNRECPFHYDSTTPRVHRLSTTTECPFHYDSTTLCASIEQYNRVSISLWLDYAVWHTIDWAVQPECPFHYDSTTPCASDWAVQPSVHFILTRLRQCASIEQYNRDVHFIMTRLRACALIEHYNPNVHFIMTRLRRVSIEQYNRVSITFWLDY